MSNKYDIGSPDEQGDDYEIDGITFTVKIVRDDDMSLLDEQGEGVWCGRLEWPGPKNDFGYETRPRDFDGNAELLHFGQGYNAIWWQVPEDVQRGSQGCYEDLRREIIDLLEYGYVGVIVECEHGEKSLWGIGSMQCEYQAEVACELIDELLYERELEVADWWPSYERAYVS